MGKTRRILTPAEIRARRSNAKKSTGPRTEAGKRRVALNALKGASYAQSLAKVLCETMEALGESPFELGKMLKDLIAAHQPTNAAQRMIVEDIALLRWQKRRCERLRSGAIIHKLETLELERGKQARDLGRNSSNISQAEVLEKGLRNVPDSPAKFGELLSYLDLVTQEVEAGSFSDNARRLLAAVYGKEPTLRGAQALNLFTSLAHGQLDDSDRELYARDLRLALLRETRDAVEEYQYYLREHIEITPAMRSACLAPAPSEWRLMIRQEASIDRQIERKIKLLMQMQANELKEIESLAPAGIRTQHVVPLRRSS